MESRSMRQPETSAPRHPASRSRESIARCLAPAPSTLRRLSSPKNAPVFKRPPLGWDPWTRRLSVPPQAWRKPAAAACGHLRVFRGPSGAVLSPTSRLAADQRSPKQTVANDSFGSRLCENSWVAKNVISDGPREFDLTRLSGLERTQTELWRTPADRSREFSHSLGRTVTSGLAGAELSHDGAKFGQLRSVTARIPLPQCGRCRFAPVQSGLR